MKRLIGFFRALLAFIIFTTPAIVVHEFAHLGVAKMHGVSVPQFSVGGGPSIVHKAVGDTVYHVRAIPFGGYVIIDEVDTLSLWVRAQILLAGPLSTIILALGIIYCLIRTRINNSKEALIKAVLSMKPPNKEERKDTQVIVSPIGIARMAGDVLKERDLQNCWAFFGAMCLGLGIFNLFPIPPLDGGKLALLLIETQFEIGNLAYALAHILGLLSILGIMLVSAIRHHRRRKKLMSEPGTLGTENSLPEDDHSHQSAK